MSNLTRRWWPALQTRRPRISRPSQTAGAPLSLAARGLSAPAGVGGRSLGFPLTARTAPLDAFRVPLRGPAAWDVPNLAPGESAWQTLEGRNPKGNPRGDPGGAGWVPKPMVWPEAAIEAGWGSRGLRNVSAGREDRQRGFSDLRGSGTRAPVGQRGRSKQREQR
jgi:hypothetical protein